MYSNISQGNASTSCGSTPAHWLGHNHTLKCLDDFIVSIKWKLGVWAVALCNLRKVLDMAMKLWSNHDCFHLLCHLVPVHFSACKQRCFVLFFLQSMIQQVCLQWEQFNNFALYSTAWIQKKTIMYLACNGTKQTMLSLTWYRSWAACQNSKMVAVRL